MTQVQTLAGRERPNTAVARTSPDGAFLDAFISAQDTKPHRDSRIELRSPPNAKITKLSYRRSTQETCAAAVLFCAGSEMGLIPYSKMDARQAKDFETDLYKRIGELAEAHHRGQPTTIATTRAAKTMGMNPTIILFNTPNSQEDKNEQTRVANGSEAFGIPVAWQSRPRPMGDKSRRILMVEVREKGAVVGHHVLLERRDGSLMDPGYGSNHRSLAQLNREMAPRGRQYRKYGIAIDLDRRG
jgi:hypothetical protein